MKNKPKISIITPNFNGHKFIPDTFTSIKAQTYEEWEWIVIDDNSSDNSRDLLQQICAQDPRVKTILFQQNMGAATARNCGIEASTGEFIAFLDADDCWEPNKLNLFIEQMVQNNWDMCYGNYIKMKPDGDLGRDVIQTPPSVTYEDLLRTCSICTSTAIMRKSVVGHVRMKPELKRGQDYVFWLEILKNNCVTAHRVSELPLTRYRVGNGESLSANKLKKAYGQWQIYRQHLRLDLIHSIIYFVSYAYWGFKKHKMF